MGKKHLDINPFETKRFKSLKAKWDKKLKALGFEDLENSDGSLKASTHPRTVAHALPDKEARETYYRTASQLLHTYNFASEMDKRIWELHCDGIGVRSIMRKLGLGHHKIELVIAELKKAGKLK